MISLRNSWAQSVAPLPARGTEAGGAPARCGDVQHPHSRGWARRYRQPAADPRRPRRYLCLPQQRRSTSLSGALGGDRREVAHMTTTTTTGGGGAAGTALTPAERTSRARARAQATLPEGTNGKLLQAVLLEVAAATLANDPPSPPASAHATLRWPRRRPDAPPREATAAPAARDDVHHARPRRSRICWSP